MLRHSGPTAKQSFANYLQDERRMATIKGNASVKKFITAFQAGEPNFELANRFFNDLPPNADGSEYFATTTLSLELVEVQASIMGALAGADIINEDDFEELANVVKTPVFNRWINLAFATAMNDLLTKQGNVEEAILSVLEKSGVTKSMVTAGGDKLKWSLLTGYVTNVICSSDFTMNTMNKSCKVDGVGYEVSVYQLFSKCLHDYMICQASAGVTVNSDFVLQVNQRVHQHAEKVDVIDGHASVTVHESALSDAQARVRDVVGIKMVKLMMSDDMANAVHVTKAILSNPALINKALSDFQILSSGDLPAESIQKLGATPEGYLKFLLCDSFNPEQHVSFNLGRLNSQLNEFFSTEELREFGYTAEVVTSGHPSVKQSEALMLGAVLWNLQNWYRLTRYNVNVSDTRRNELFRENVAEMQQSLNGNLDKFAPLLQPVTERLAKSEPFDGSALIQVKRAEPVKIAEPEAPIRPVSPRQVRPEHPSSVDLKPISSGFSSLPVEPQSSVSQKAARLSINANSFRKWVPRILIGLAIALGVAAIVATAVLTAGAALPVWAIAAYAVGGALVAAGGVGVVASGVKAKREKSHSVALVNAVRGGSVSFAGSTSRFPFRPEVASGKAETQELLKKVDDAVPDRRGVSSEPVVRRNHCFGRK